MLYIATPSSSAIRVHMAAGRLGCMTTPVQGNLVPEGSFYTCDNGKFGKGWPGAEAWWAWLQDRVARHGPKGCGFATAPDTVADPETTLYESLPWLPRIRSLGIPAAFVAQDGCTDTEIPWDEFDVLFLGGTDYFKLGAEGERVTKWALDLGTPVHMGRVNSRKRLKYALDLGCTTVDGTYLAFGPDTNLPKLIKWFNDLGLDNFKDVEPIVA